MYILRFTETYSVQVSGDQCVRFFGVPDLQRDAVVGERVAGKTLIPARIRKLEGKENGAGSEGTFVCFFPIVPRLGPARWKSTRPLGFRSQTSSGASIPFMEFGNRWSS